MATAGKKKDANDTQHRSVNLVIRPVERIPGFWDVADLLIRHVFKPMQIGAGHIFHYFFGPSLSS